MVINTTSAAPDARSYRDYEIWRQMRLEYARRAAKAKDILGWGKALFPDKFYLPYCQTLHGYFVDIRLDAFTDTEAPRNTAKTAIKCNLIPTFQALEEPNLFRHYLNVQATQTKALAVNTSIKVELESNELLRMLYGDPIGARWTDQQFVTSKGVIFTAIGAGQSVRGLNYLNIRPDYLIIDDLYDEDHIHNVQATLKMNDWFWGSLYPARARSRRCAVHLQGTAINDHDLLEKLKKRSGVKCRTFKSIVDYGRREVLWPELASFEKLQADAVLMGPDIFAREMQNERRDEKTSILKKKYWRYYQRLPDAFDIVVVSWDMTFQETESGSYVVGQAWGRRGADFFLFPIMVRKRMGFAETLERVVAFDKDVRQLYRLISGHLVEEKANGAAVMSMLHKTIPGLVPILPHGKKIARAEAITPVLAAGNVWIPDPALCSPDPDTGQPWVVEYVDECEKFRGSDTEINDQVDTTTQAVNYLNQTLYPEREPEEEETFVELGDQGETDE